MRFEGALPERREVVPRSFVKDAEGKRLLCGDFGRPPPRPSRSRLRRRRVCLCVCYNGGGARLSTPSRRIHRTSSRASGSRAAAVPRLGLNRRSVTSREDIFAHESSNRKEKTFERVQLCAPWRVRGESGVPNRGSGQWWPGARIENVVCCVCDAVGLSMPAGSRGRDGEIELVLCEIERVR
jgi:hypothetical protein